MIVRARALVLLGLVVASVLGKVSASKKKGLCVGPSTHMCNDFKLWHKVNWWYDWGRNFAWLRMNTNCSEYAPNWVAMVWGWRPHNDYPVVIGPNTKYVLGFNEPNIRSQGNITAQDAARHWQEIERNSRGLPLVSPAANGCNKSHNCISTAFEWFDEFFKHCNGCKVDYLATHYYECSANKTMAFLRDLWHRYHKRIWLTEFACPMTHSVHDQMVYMRELLPQLEAAHFVYRYSWFQSRLKDDTGYVWKSASLLQPHSSTLTQLGHFYNDFPSSSAGTIVG